MDFRQIFGVVIIFYDKHCIKHCSCLHGRKVENVINF